MFNFSHQKQSPTLYHSSKPLQLNQPQELQSSSTNQSSMESSSRKITVSDADSSSNEQSSSGKVSPGPILGELLHWLQQSMSSHSSYYRPILLFYLFLSVY